MDGGAIIGITVTIGLIVYFIGKYIGENKSKTNATGLNNVSSGPTTEAPSSYQAASKEVLGSGWEDEYITDFKPPTASVMKNLSPWDRLRHKVIIRDGMKCTVCGATIRLTVDHIQELSLGGTNAMSNLRTLCADCHEDRHGRAFMDREFEVDRRYGEKYQTNPKIAALLQAKSDGRGVGIRYVDREKNYSERVIHPSRIWSDPKTHVQYVEAFDELDRDSRVFRISRMKLSKSRLNFYDDPEKARTMVRNPGDDWKSRNGFKP